MNAVTKSTSPGNIKPQSLSVATETVHLMRLKKIQYIMVILLI